MDKVDWLAYAWVAFLSIFGGTAYNVKKIKDGHLKRFSISEWVGDIVIAGFIGLMTYYLCMYSGVNQAMTGVLVGICSHQGTRGIAIIEETLFRKFGIRKEDFEGK